MTFLLNGNHDISIGLQQWRVCPCDADNAYARLTLTMELSELFALEELDGRDGAVAVQEEPALEIALPQVFTQPPLVTLQRGKVKDIEGLIGQIYRAHVRQPDGALGPDYQALVTEFQPLFAWSIASWDYLLTTQGCRFVLRGSDEKLCTRGDYRAVTDTDFSRLTHRIFRQLALGFAEQAEQTSFAAFLRQRFWETAADSYVKLEDPPDPRQRKLTAWSYLRCVPYQFLNPFHHALVHQGLVKLPDEQRRAIAVYFLDFSTPQATAETLQRPLDDTQELIRQGLVALLVSERLIYCLLRQIERY